VGSSSVLDVKGNTAHAVATAVKMSIDLGATERSLLGLSSCPKKLRLRPGDVRQHRMTPGTAEGCSRRARLTGLVGVARGQWEVTDGRVTSYGRYS